VQENRLEQITAEQGSNVKHLVSLVKDNKEIQTQMKVGYRVLIFSFFGRVCITCEIVRMTHEMLMFVPYLIWQGCHSLRDFPATHLNGTSRWSGPWSAIYRQGDRWPYPSTGKFARRQSQSWRPQKKNEQQAVQRQRRFCICQGIGGRRCASQRRRPRVFPRLNGDAVKCLRACISRFGTINGLVDNCCCCCSTDFTSSHFSPLPISGPPRRN